MMCHGQSGDVWIDLGHNGLNLNSDLHWSTLWCLSPGARITIEDVDGDSLDDFVCHDQRGETAIEYAHDGLQFPFLETNFDFFSFSPWCGHHGSIFEVSDVDGDNRADLVCSNAFDDYRWVDFAHNGFGTTDWEGNRANEPIHVAPAPTPHPDFCQGGSQQLEQGHFDDDAYLDFMCHQRGTGYKWIDYGRDGYTNNPRYMRHWDSSWCWKLDEHFFVGDLDADGIDDWICHSETGRQWIDYGGDPSGFAGNDYVSPLNSCPAPSTFSISDEDNDGRPDFVCEGSVWRFVDYAHNGFGGVDHSSAL